MEQKMFIAWFCILFHRDLIIYFETLIRAKVVGVADFPLLASNFRCFST